VPLGGGLSVIVSVRRLAPPRPTRTMRTVARLTRSTRQSSMATTTTTTAAKAAAAARAAGGVGSPLRKLRTRPEPEDAWPQPARRAAARTRQLIGSFLYPEFLDCNPGLDEKIITFLDELYLSEFRKPWTPGEGIYISTDAPHNCNHQMSIHRKSYIRQNYSKEDVTIKTYRPQYFLLDLRHWIWSYNTWYP